MQDIIDGGTGHQPRMYLRAPYRTVVPNHYSGIVCTLGPVSFSIAFNATYTPVWALLEESHNDTDLERLGSKPRADRHETVSETSPLANMGYASISTRQGKQPVTILAGHPYSKR